MDLSTECAHFFRGIFELPSFLLKSGGTVISVLLKTKKHRKTFDIQPWTVIIIVLDCVLLAQILGFGGAAKFLFPKGKRIRIVCPLFLTEYIRNNCHKI